MKRFEKEELMEQGLKVAEAHGKDTVYATEDGEIFLPENKSFAQDYNAKQLRKFWEDSVVHEIKVPVAEEEQPDVIEGNDPGDEQK